MEILQLASVALSAAAADDETCKAKPPEKPGWKANINKLGGKCSGKALHDHMSNKKDDYKYMPGPLKPFVPKPNGRLALSDCDSDPPSFPVQAHHIIPKNHLPDEPVCAFLAEKYTKHPEFELTADTYYDCDHANNGYCLPYATALKDWQQAKSGSPEKREEEKKRIASRLMDKTKRQLHQGSHAWDAYDEVEDMEEERTHTETAGYLEAVSMFLQVVQFGAELHVANCNICSNKEGKKRKGAPREATVKYMNQASGLIKLLMDANRIFVSRLASEHFKKRQGISVPGWM